MPDILIPHFARLPPCYQTVVTELLGNLDSDPNIEIQKQHFEKFIEKYTMIPQLFEYYYGLEENVGKQNEIVAISFKHFATVWAADLIHPNLPENYKGYVWSNFDGIENEIYPILFQTTLPLKQKEAIIVEFLSFPHKHLFLVSKLYEENSGSMTSDIREMYLKNVDLYQKLKRYYENDPTQFLNSVLKLENFDSQCSNVELLLGSHPYDKSIWEYYFKLLQDKNEKKTLLDVYRRYSSLFLDDVEIKDKISKLAELINSSPANIVESEDEIPKTSTSKKLLKQTIKNFSFETALFQPPPFRNTLNNYLYQNANGNVTVKLQMTTKHFFCTFPFNVVERLEVTQEPKNYNKNSLSIPAKNKLFSKLDNLYLSNSLFLASIKPSKIIAKICRCDLKYLRIQNQKLMFKDFEFFAQSGNIELLSLEEVIDEKKDMVPLENLLAKTPKIFYIKLFSDLLTPQTFQNLNKLHFKSKILHFTMFSVFNLIDVPSCVEFFKQNLGSDAKVNIEFEDEYPEDNYIQLSIALNAMVNEWQPTDEKPEITLFLAPMFM